MYYTPIKPFSTGGDIKLLDAINNIYSDFPSYGYRRLTKQLQNDGYNVGKKIVKKAMKYMGIEALYPKPKTYFQLIREEEVMQPNAALPAKTIVIIISAKRL